MKKWFDEINAEPWDSVQIWEFLLSTLLTVWVAYYANTGERWVPFLDGANLLFHEAGHPIFGLFSDRLMVYGGTLGQLVFPMSTSTYFWMNRKTASFYICLVWCMQNLWNIARYMADARAQILPLVGNGDRLHDWTEILVRWHALESDTRWAGRLSFLAGAGVLLVWWWLYKKFRLSLDR